MPFIRSSLDGTLLHYVDYKPAANPPRFQPADNPAKDHSKSDIALVFIHGWPMSHQMYEHLMLPLCETYGIRSIAPDRRGFGKSDWNTSGSKDITYDTFSQDSIDVIENAKLGRFFFVASSMGCGETLLAYLNMPEELQKQCGGFIWLGPSLPFPLATEANPTAPSRALWDMILTGFRQDRTGFTRTALPGVFGIPFNIGIEVPETVLQKFEGIVAQADALALERCVQIITNRDFTEDLKRLDGENVKLLVIHGDNDQSKSPFRPGRLFLDLTKCSAGNPAEATAQLIQKLASKAEVKIYEKAAHGMYLTHAEKVLEDILAFVFGK
jgi:pimeloyl-ACP methyl ester carboxylesterase